EINNLCQLQSEVIQSQPEQRMEAKIEVNPYLVKENQSKFKEIIMESIKNIIEYGYFCLGSRKKDDKKLEENTERIELKEQQVISEESNSNEGSTEEIRELDLSDFINLKRLDCTGNKLTSLNVSNCCHLTKLECGDNFLTNLTLPNNLTSLRHLDLKLEYNQFFLNTPYQISPTTVTTSKLINTKQITQLLKLKVSEEYHTKTLEELTLDNFNLDELTIQEDPQEQSSTQAHIQIPPK
ncbi:7589_t:CDS:2, partial [Entrophospora sp. SA101]